MTTTQHNKKHLTTTQRMKIEDGLNKELSMAAIGRSIEKDPTTVSKEVKKYRTFQPRDKDQLPLNCARFKGMCFQKERVLIHTISQMPLY